MDIAHFHAGYAIIESDQMIWQFRRPRSRKKRIQNKWKNRAENWKPRLHVVKMGDSLICHPVVAAKLRMALAVG